MAEMRGWGVNGRGAPGVFLGNPLNQDGLISLKVLEGDMGASPDFHVVRILMVLLKEELER